MTQCIYVQSGDYTAYGLPGSTTAAQVSQASALIDAYLMRPGGILYGLDAAGQPAYMTGKTPELSFVSTAGFGPGASVVVPVTGPLNMLQVGDAMLLDAANSGTVETVQVSAIDLVHSTVTLGSTAANLPQGVQFAHLNNCTMTTGMVITENRYVPKGRSTVMLAQTPIGRVIGGTGRYAYGRRGDSATYNMDAFNLLAALSTFGGPPAWELWPANTSSGIDPRTGELWVPAGIMLAYYSEVKVRYVAGFTYANLPDVVKFATASLVASIQNNAGASTSFSNYQAGDTKITRFAETLLDQDMRMALAPYRARMFA
jgi:hypothetical protein